MGTSLAAARTFTKGDLIYSNLALLISKQEFLLKMYMIKVNDRYKLLDHDEYFVHRPNGVVEQSCEPSTVQSYQDSVTYSVVSARTILPGQLLTIDYKTLDNQVDGLESLPTIQFDCKCGPEMCRGVVVASKKGKV